MSYNFTNKLEITKTDIKDLDNLFKILSVEYKETEKELRSKVTIEKKEDKVCILIESKDIVALRASLNGVIKVLYTFENISKLIKD